MGAQRERMQNSFVKSVSPQARSDKTDKQFVKGVFRLSSKAAEFLFFSLVWLAKVTGTVVAGVLYGVFISLVYVSRELASFVRFSEPHVEKAALRYAVPVVGRVQRLLAWALVCYFRGVQELSRLSLDYALHSLLPFLRQHAPAVSSAVFRAADLAVRWFSGASIRVSAWFGAGSAAIAHEAKLGYDHARQEISERVERARSNESSQPLDGVSFVQELKLFLLWLLRPLYKFVPALFQGSGDLATQQLTLALQPAVTYSDFRQLIREPRHHLLRRAAATWLLFAVVASTMGVASFTPLFDWLFQGRQDAFAAPFTGAIKVSKQSTTLSTAGGWLEAMAYSGDGQNGDGDFLQPIHPGATTEGAAGTLAIGTVALGTVAVNNYDAAGPHFIPFKPNADGNLYGITLAIQNTATVVNNTNVVVEVLRFPNASYTGTPPSVTWSDYVTCSAVGTCTYGNSYDDVVIERQAVMRFDQTISGETLYPGQYGIHYMDFRFDPPLAVTTVQHYGFRVYYNNLTTSASWPRGTSTKLITNAANFGLGVKDVDVVDANTVTIPLANSNTAVSLNSAAGIGAYAGTVSRTQNEHWTGVYSSANGNWTITGSLSGAQTNKLTTATTGGTGAAWVNDGVTTTTLTAPATASTRLCVNSTAGFAVNQNIDIWDSDTAPVTRTIASLNASDGNCSNGPSIIVTAALSANETYTTDKNPTVARSIWKLRFIQGAEEAITQVLSTTKFCVGNAAGFSTSGTSNNINLWDNNSALGANRITTVTVDDAACTTNPGDDSLTVASTIAAYTLDQSARVAEINANLSNFGPPDDGDAFRFTSLNMGQNPTKTGAGTSMVLLYGKTVAPATSANNYPWIANQRHLFFVAYGDADTSAPVDGDFVVVGAGATDPDTGDSTNLSNDLLIANTSGHTVTVDKNFEMPLIYTGATGGGVNGGGTTAATASYGGSGFVSMLLTSRSKLAVSNAANQHYRLAAPGRVLLSSDASLELGSSSAALPNTSSVDLYFDSSGPDFSTTLSADCNAAATSCTLTSVSGLYIGDVVEIKDNNSSPILVSLASVNTSTKVVTFMAAVNYYPWVASIPTGYAYTVAQGATVSRGPSTYRPTGADRRAFVYGARAAGVRNNIYSYGSDNYRTPVADLAVDIDANIDTGFLAAEQTMAGNTWLDVKGSSGSVAGNWSALDPLSVAQGTSLAVNNWDSTLGMGADDNGNVFPTWAGANGAGAPGTLGYNADAQYNAEMTEIGTVPLTNAYNADYNGGGGVVYSSNYGTSSAWTIFGDGANTEANDAVYFGDQGNTPVYGLEFNVGTAISADATRVWEYYQSGVGWTEFTPTFGWKHVPRGTNNYGLGEYCIPFNSDPTYPTATVSITDTNTMLTASQLVKIKDNDSPTVIRRISSVTAGVPANVVFTEVVPSGYTTAQSAKLCVPNGGNWQPMNPASLFTQTGRTLISWNSWDTPSAAKTSVNSVNAYWVRNRLSSFTSWTTSPTNQTTPVSMQGVEDVSSYPFTVSNSVNEARFNHLSAGASFDPNETWVLRYNDNSTSVSTLKTTRWYESQVASWGTAHRWTSPNPDGETSAYYEKNTQEGNWHTMNGGFGWADYSVYAKVYMNQASDTTERKLGIFLRQDAEDYGYALYIYKSNTVQRMQWYTTAAGAETAIGSSTNITFNANTWYCVRAEASGTTLQAKFWSPASEDADCNGDANEPGTWTESETNSTFTAGRFGLAADAILARFDDVTVRNTGLTETWFNDNFNDTGCWNVIGSIHGSQGCAYNGTPFTSSYINFTIKHKGGVQCGESGANACSPAPNTPEQGDEIYVSPLMRGSNIGLDEATGIATSDAYTKYENWDFVYNSGSSNWSVTGSQYGSAGTAAPGSTYTSPGGEISLRIKAGTPSGPKFGTRAAYFNNSFVRGAGSFAGLNVKNSAILMQPTWALTGSSTQYNIEGSAGVAAQKGTLDFWFKPNFTGSPDYVQYLFDYAANTNTDRILVRIMPTGVIEAVVAPALGRSANNMLYTPFSATAGQWYHFRLAWEDSDTGQLNMKRAWLDGAAFATNQGTALGGRGANAGIIRIGNSWQYNAGFDGAIDELAIFDDAIDTSGSCNWGDFTAPASAWTSGQSAGCGTSTGSNIYLAHFDTAMDPQKGFIWADYFTGLPALVFVNGADTLTNDRIRVTTYPNRTRLWVDNTGSPFSAAARVKYSEGYALGTSAGWMTGFQYHHRAASANSQHPISSPVMNMRRQIRLWSDEEAPPGNRMYPINQGYGFLLYNPKELDVNHMEMTQQYYGFYLSGNAQRTATSHVSQYIRKSAFNNVQANVIYTLNKTLGSQYIDANNFSSLDYYYYPFREDSSSNITFSNNYVTGYTASGYLLYMNLGRIFTISGNKILNAYYPVWLAAGTAKVTLTNNQLWRYRRGLWLNGNSFITMSGNSFDGGVSSEANNGYYGTGIYVAPASSNVEITDANSTFGKSVWNEADVSMPPDTASWLAGSLLRFIGEGTSFNSNFHYLGSSTQDKFGGEYLTTAIPGVDVRVGSGKDIVNYTNFGLMRTSGASLPDTTVKTAGGYGWRMESTSKTDALEYTAKVVGVAGEPLAVTGYIRLNDDYGTANLPTVTLSGLGMTGANLTWTAAATTDTWQQFVVSGTPTESALATVTVSIKSTPVVADSGMAENVDDGGTINMATVIEDTDKSWTWNQWTGYKLRDDQGFVFDVIGNTATRLLLKGTRIPFANTLPTQPYGGTYEIFAPPYVYLDDVSVLSGTVDTGTLDFHSQGQPVSPWLATGLTAAGIWGAQYSTFADITGSFGQLLNDRLAIKRALVSDAGATTTQFITDLTETTTNFYQNQVLVMMSGQNNGLSRRISAYNGTTKTITVDTAFPYAPAFNDDFVILSQYAAASSGSGATAEEIAEAVWEYVDRKLTSASLSGGGALATSAEIATLQADVTYIKNAVDDIYTDTQYITGVVDDILAKWGANNAAGIMADLDTVKTRLGQYTDASDVNTLFGRTKFLQEKWGTQTAQAIYDKADDAYDKILEVQGELGYDGQATTAYQDLQTLKGYTDQLEGYVDTLETYVGLPADASTADTLFGRIKKNYEAVQALNNITAQQVWEYGTREITGGVSLSDPTQVWDVAAASLSTVGSIGKLIADNLDAAISSRGTSNLTAADVWSEATRTITGISNDGLAAIATEIWTDASRTLTSDDVTAQRVWDTLLSAITTTNSIGLLLKTNIDTSLSAVKTDLTSEINANEAKIDTLIANSIVAQSSVNDSTPTVTEFDTNLTNANDNYYNDGVLLFTSGLNSGQVRRIYDYAGATKTITVDPALVIAPSNSDTFTILAQSAAASLDASTIWNYATRRLTDAQLDSGSLATLANLSTAQTALATEINQNETKIDSLINSLIVDQKAVNDLSPSTTQFITSLTNANNDFYNDGVMVFTSGNNAGQVRKISDYDGTTKRITVSPALTIAPANGDTFTILAQSSSASLDPSSIWSYATRRLTDAQLDSGSLSTLADLTTTETALSTDISNVQNSVDLLTADLISIRSTVAAAPAPAVSSFGTNLTSAVNDLYNNALITFTSGVNAGVARRIEDYDGATKVLTIEPDLASAPANGDAFTILKQIAVPTGKIAGIQSDVAVIKADVTTIKADVALIKTQLDNIDSAIDDLQTDVQNIEVTGGTSSNTIVYRVQADDMFTELSSISTAISSINTSIGKIDNSMLASILSLSQESLTDTKYIKNKLADFKAVTTVQRQVLENTAAPVINTWYTSGSVDLNMMITNPADVKTKVPFKIYLPKEARLEHVMEDGGLNIQYDVQLDTLYASGEIELGPKESVKKTVKMRDIWQIADTDLNLIKAQAANYYKEVESSSLSAQALLLKNDIESRADRILRTQKENTATPQDKIMTYRDNMESLSAVEKELEELKALVVQFDDNRGFLGSLGGIQTVAVWGIILAFVSGFSLLTLILFSMWRHQVRIANNQLVWQARAMSKGKLDEVALRAMLSDGKISPNEHKVLSRHMSQRQVQKLHEQLQHRFSSWLSQIMHMGVARNAFIIIVTVLLATAVYVSIVHFLGGIRNPDAVPVSGDSANMVADGDSTQDQPNAPDSIAEPPAEEAPKEPVSVEAPATWLKVASAPSGKLNVRKDPSLSSPVIARLDSGAAVEYTDSIQTAEADPYRWYKVSLPDNLTGWVYGEYVGLLQDAQPN